MKLNICAIILFLLGWSFLSIHDNQDIKKQKLTARPNILFIAVDDLKPEIGAYGASHISSPNLDALASQSLIFERAYCNIPVCGASRASILSGLRPTRDRFINFSARKDEDAPRVPSLPLTLKKYGYRTISNGKVYHHDHDDKAAWNEIWHPIVGGNYYASERNDTLRNTRNRGPAFESANVNDSTYADGKIANKSIADLKNLKKTGEPFFLAVGFLKPHLPFNAPSRYWGLYDEKEITLPENYLQPNSTHKDAFHNFGELRNYYGIPNGKKSISDELAKKLIHGYYASVSYVDAQIGRVLKTLDELGLAKNTIVVLWGDHGWNLGNHKLWCKHSTFESALRTPLLIKLPEVTMGERNQNIVEYIDVYPTLCDLIGIDSPAHLEGISLKQLFYGGNLNKNFAVSKFKDAITLIKDHYFYTEWIDDNGKAYQKMLFDHNTDPLELDNLAEKAVYKDTLLNLAAELRKNWGKDF